MYKLYAAILNKRFTKYLETTQNIVEEQNGFRKLHARVDYIFTLACVTRNHKLAAKDTFTCFIDMQKAFDTVSRTGLLYKLQQPGVCRLLYQAINAI